MSKRFFSRSGGAPQNEQWEAKLRDAARNFSYPPTPDLVSAVKTQLVGESRLKSGLRSGSMTRRLIWTALILLLLVGGLLAVPQVRAALVEYLQIGSVRIFLAEPTSTPTPLPATPQPKATPTSTPQPTPTPLASVLDLAGETTFAEAEQRAGFPVRLPTYPPDLGPPDRVYLQDMNGPVVVLVWLEPDQPAQVRFSLHELGPDTFAQKGEPRLIQETTVQGQRAAWTEGPYLLQFRRGNRVDYDLGRLVEGHVLVWAEGKITYRLENSLSLTEAVKIAESLR